MDNITNYTLWFPVLASVLIYSITLVFYRLYLHPLAKFPGPKIAAITRYYEAYYDIIQNGQYTFKIADMHRQYGPIIRISPYELHVNDPSFFEKLYRQEGRWNKYAWSYDAFSAKRCTICTPDHDIHRTRRAALSRFFSKTTVAKRQDMIHSRVEKLCNRIHGYVGSGATVNLGLAISAFTQDVGTEYILGKSYNNLELQDFNVGITSIFQNSGFIWRITKHVRWFGPTMKAIPLSLVERMGDNGAKAFLSFLKRTEQDTKDIMAAHSGKSSDESSPSTMVDEILESRLPPEEKGFERINEDVGTILGAAFETTASSMRLILYYIYTDADILRQLRSELAEIPANKHSSKDLRISELEQLPYLTAVLMEGLRLSPGIATRMARIALDRDLVYANWSIPKGTPVGMTTLLMHTDETIYPEPKHFNPDRWIDIEKRKGAERTYAPFSRGTRNCLGMQLAWAELYLTIASIVQRFDFDLQGVGLKDIECDSDQFVIGTKEQNNMSGYVSLRKD